MGRDDSASYGLVMGFIYIFNIIVGTGALTMPKAFENTGIILSSVLLIFLTIMSFITATFMFEAMAIANAIKNYSKFEGTYIKQRNGFVNPVFENNENVSKLADTDTSLINEERPLIANNSSALLADGQYQSQNDSSMTEYSTNIEQNRPVLFLSGYDLIPLRRPGYLRRCRAQVTQRHCLVINLKIIF